MTKSTITREQAQKIIVAADEVITALAGTNEDVHPDDSKKMCELWDDLNDRHAPPVVVRELARMALAAMDSEPVAFTEKHEISNMHATGLYLRAWPADRARNAVEGYTIPLYTTPQPISLVNSEPVAYIFKHPAGRLFWALTDESNKGQNDVMPVYASPQPAPERDQVRIAHAEWSQATFGNVGPVGPLKHLSKEALETAADPDDLSEWADMQFLLWDAQRRSGITDEQITQAMIDKLAVNKQREWPEPKDGEPRLHIK
ncbi:Eaa1 [Klebsiella pneumoniae]|nr:Eaa1 [Klebsiella pneumoniae]SSJ47916.1 Eaa1 [Klebsiella pneumoniae]VTN93562.1 Eaa1 [Klebsiella pneumoniae]